MTPKSGDQKNFLMAIILSAVVLFGFTYFFQAPEEARKAQEQAQQAAQQNPSTQPGLAAAGNAQKPLLSREEALKQSERTMIETPRVKGSINLRGGRLDDLVLMDYRQDIDPQSPPVVLLSPDQAAYPYQVTFGWLADSGVHLPTAESIWHVAQGSAHRLSPGQDVTIEWDNGSGLTFRQIYSIDANYLVQVKTDVVNLGETAVSLVPYASVARGDVAPHHEDRAVKEGVVAYLGDNLYEYSYENFRENKLKDADKWSQITGGFAGFSDKYWLTALLPDQQHPYNYHFRYSQAGGRDMFQVDYTAAPLALKPGATISFNHRVFAGAKEIKLVEHYAKDLNVPDFDRSIDLGWMKPLARLFYYALSYFNHWIGSYAIAIMMLTVLVKLVLFPLTRKSLLAMNRMKQLSPKMKKIQETYKNDKTRLNQEMMGLYKKEKINPAAGCLPMLLQIPVFFALYRVLYVGIEMRHAPLFGWVHDLSAPDPLTVFNLFGLIPFTPPAFLMIGPLAIVLGITMFLQQAMNPAVMSNPQMRMMKFMPLIFVFIFARFPAGLVVYWIWNNVLSMAQQWAIYQHPEIKEDHRKQKEDLQAQKLAKKSGKSTAVIEGEAEDISEGAKPKKKAVKKKPKSPKKKD